MNKKNLYLVACGMGKTYFCQHTNAFSLELPFEDISNLAECFQKKIVYNRQVSFNECKEDFKNLISNITKAAISKVLEKQPNAVILCPAIRLFYESVRFSSNFEEFNLITLVPSRDQKYEYYWRFKHREPDHPFEKEINTAELHLASWDPLISFFEEASKTDSGIIFTRIGEYLSDYLDMETGNLKEEMLFR